MKFKRVIVLATLLSLWGGTMMFADSATQKVRVIINGVDQEEGGIIEEGRTYLPLRQMATSLQALVEWDDQNKRATVYKPNVHMFLFKEDKNNTMFGNVEKGFQGSFKVFAQIDNLKTEITAVKISIFDPDGREKVIQSEDVSPKNDNFWFATNFISYKFDASGKYAIRFFIKTKSVTDWTVVSEKLISSK
jgi:hypothetical protein